MNLMHNTRLTFPTLLILVCTYFSCGNIHAAARGPSAGLEEWIRIPANNRYGSMGLIDVLRFEGDVARLGRDHQTFYGNLASALCENEEFMASVYLNEAKPPFKKEAVFNLLAHGAEAAISAFGVYTFTQQSNLTTDCGGCFSAHHIDSLTPDCSTCYKDVINPILIRVV